MQQILMVVHIIIGVFLVGLILLQKTNSDGLKGLSGGGNMDSVMSQSMSANFMTKLTAILAGVFIINCLVLANLSARQSHKSIASKIEAHQPVAAETRKDIPIAN